MELTKKTQFSVKCKDGKSRNFILYFLNNIQILRLKIPFNTDFGRGHGRITFFTDEYIKDNRLYIKKVKRIGFKNGSPISKERIVSYPISKQKLNYGKENSTKRNLWT